jgi:hypothetical protein
VIERIEVTPGPGTVIRYGGIVAWADQGASPALISFLVQSARNLGPSPRGGRQIGDHIAGVLASRDPEPHVAFVVIGPSDHGWASLLHGTVQVWDGARWLTPTPSPGWLQAIITPRPAITVGAAGVPAPPVQPDAMWDLEAGVVPGAGFVLTPGAAPSRSAVVRPPAQEPEEPVPDAVTVVAAVTAVAAAETDPTTVVPATAQTEPEPEPQPVVRRPVAPGPAGSLDLRTATIPAGPPLPRGNGPDPRIAGAPVVAGVLCPRGHLNRPGLAHCARCHTPMPVGAQEQVSGTRPPLGVLVTDEGEIYRLDRSYLVGSNSSRDPTVGGGLARPLVLRGSDVSGSHAEVRLTDWDVTVVDRGSAAGTCIYEPGAAEWARLRPYEPRAVSPGTHVAFGQRVVTFLSPWVSST